MNSNKSEILVLAVFSFYMHAVKISEQVHVHIFQN